MCEILIDRFFQQIKQSTQYILILIMHNPMMSYLTFAISLRCISANLLDKQVGFIP